MKRFMTFILESLLSVLMLGGCSQPETDFIPGMYVKQFAQEYNVGSDTLVISTVNVSEGNYSIARHLAYVPIKDGKRLKQQSQRANWLGSYNKDSKQLTVQPSGKVLTFSEAKQCLYIGNSVYNKVK
jgi:hypothetical protein